MEEDRLEGTKGWKIFGSKEGGADIHKSDNLGWGGGECACVCAWAKEFFKLQKEYMHIVIHSDEIIFQGKRAHFPPLQLLLIDADRK